MIPKLNVAFNQTTNNLEVTVLSRHIHIQFYVITVFCCGKNLFNFNSSFYFLNGVKSRHVKYSGVEGDESVDFALKHFEQSIS